MSQKYADREKSLGLTPADVPLEALPLVELTTEDIQRALELAEKRNDSYKAIDGGVVFGDRDSLTNHQIGILGELAIAKLYGIDIDANTYRWGDNGQDHSLFGVNIDVKSTATEKVRRPDLLVRTDKPLRAELYIRAHVVDWDSSSARVRIIGCASQDVIKEQPIDDQLFDVPNYIVNPEEMSFLPMLQPTS